ncbi:MAG: hypothetical protein UIM53_01065 [Acutalibacteraceae bacterium]|nr:hypothetical protein [Acutalibacteraceae bacterium]
MEIKGSPQEIQVFINTFQDKNNPLNKQQLKQIEELLKKTPVVGATDVIQAIPHKNQSRNLQFDPQKSQQTAY